jgi:hypothetical protein
MMPFLSPTRISLWPPPPRCHPILMFICERFPKTFRQEDEKGEGEDADSCGLLWGLFTWIHLSSCYHVPSECGCQGQEEEEAYSPSVVFVW